MIKAAWNQGAAKGILVAPYWNLNINKLILPFIEKRILVAPYWNLNKKKIRSCFYVW